MEKKKPKISLEKLFNKPFEIQVPHRMLPLPNFSLSSDKLRQERLSQIKNNLIKEQEADQQKTQFHASEASNILISNRPVTYYLILLILYYFISKFFIYIKINIYVQYVFFFFLYIILRILMLLKDYIILKEMYPLLRKRIILKLSNLKQDQYPKPNRLL